MITLGANVNAYAYNELSDMIAGGRHTSASREHVYNFYRHRRESTTIIMMKTTICINACKRSLTVYTTYRSHHQRIRDVCQVSLMIHCQNAIEHGCTCLYGTRSTRMLVSVLYPIILCKVCQLKKSF